jgi:nucleoside 2-deoxyribosyltransferase
MKSKIYIASGLKNYKRVIELRDKLKEYGISLTYDWAEVYKTAVDSNKTESESDWKEIAEKEYDAVWSSDLFLLVTPGGRGTHFELGTAYAKEGMPIIILNEADEHIAFYTLPGIQEFNKEEEVISKVRKLLGK